MTYPNFINKAFNFLFLPNQSTIEHIDSTILEIGNLIDEIDFSHLKNDRSLSNQFSIYKSNISSLKKDLQISKIGKLFKDVFIGKEILNSDYKKCIAHIKEIENKICYHEDINNLDLSVNRYTKQHPNSKTLTIKISDNLIVNIHEEIIKNSSKVIKNLIDEINQDESDLIDLSFLSIPPESLIEALRFAYNPIFDPDKLVTTLQGVDALNIEVPKHENTKAVQHLLTHYRDYSNDTFVRCCNQLPIQSLPREERLELLRFFLQRSDHFDSGIILQQIKNNMPYFEDYREVKIFENMRIIFDRGLVAQYLSRQI